MQGPPKTPQKFRAGQRVKIWERVLSYPPPPVEVRGKEGTIHDYGEWFGSGGAWVHQYQVKIKDDGILLINEDWLELLP